MPLAEIAAWFTQNPDLGEILDRKGEGPAPPMFISEHPDTLAWRRARLRQGPEARRTT